MRANILLLLAAFIATSASRSVGARQDVVLNVRDEVLKDAESILEKPMEQQEEDTPLVKGWDNWTPDAGIFSTPEAQQDLVTELPGAVKLGRRRMFSGYIPVEGQGRELFYWLVESDKGFRNAPVMLWTNGGPGCSGLIGFLTEQGPFRPTRFGHLEDNKFAWTKVASMVFIEQPVGVGFSRTQQKGEVYNDANAAKDNYRFVVNFFARYPELRTNEFYISSESYGGHYMPTLAKELVDRGGVPNFKGFFVGNPLTSGQLRDVGEFMTFHGHQLIPQPLFSEYHKNECTKNTYSEVCQHLASEARSIVAGLDPYALDFPTCTVRAEKQAILSKLGLIAREELTEEQEQVHAAIENDDVSVAASRRRRRQLQYFPNRYQPCEESYATSWLNRPDVRKSLHVRPGAPVWSACNNFINIIYNHTDVEASMVPYYTYLSKKPIKIWVYSGDDDSICPTWAEQQWVWTFSASSRWNPWHVQGQVAGYQVHMKGLVFSTVHGAGHMVPSTRPMFSLELLKRFIRS